MKRTYANGAFTITLLLANTLSILAEPMPIELSVNFGNNRDLVRRQAFGAPYPGGPGACSPCGCPGCCQCAPPPPPPPQFLPPPPQYAPQFLPPPLPVPAPIPAPVGPPPCNPGGFSGQYIGCAPPVPQLAPPPLPLPPPVVAPAGRLIPQALPGAPCEPDTVECTGGSVCSMGICLCPPELVQEGTVCVSRTIYGVVPGVPPPPPPAFYPPSVPQPVPVAPRPFFDCPCGCGIHKRSVGDKKVECRTQQ